MIRSRRTPDCPPTQSRRPRVRLPGSVRVLALILAVGGASAAALCLRDAVTARYGTPVAGMPAGLLAMMGVPSTVIVAYAAVLLAVGTRRPRWLGLPEGDPIGSAAEDCYVAGYLQTLLVSTLALVLWQAKATAGAQVLVQGLAASLATSVCGLACTLVLRAHAASPARIVADAPALLPRPPGAARSAPGLVDLQGDMDALARSSRALCATFEAAADAGRPAAEAIGAMHAGLQGLVAQMSAIGGPRAAGLARALDHLAALGDAATQTCRELEAVRRVASGAADGMAQLTDQTGTSAALVSDLGQAMTEFLAVLQDFADLVRLDLPANRPSGESAT